MNTAIQNTMEGEINLNLYLNEETGVFEAIDKCANELEENVEGLLKTERKKKNKELRVLGKKYGTKGARKMRDNCCAHLAEKKTERSFLCGAIDEGNRKDTFNFFLEFTLMGCQKNLHYGFG